MRSHYAALLLPFASLVFGAPAQAPTSVSVSSDGPTSTPSGGPNPTQSHTTIEGPLIPVSQHPPVTTSLTETPTASYTTHSPTHYPTGHLPACKKIQYSFPPGQGQNAQRAEAVKNMYLTAWNAYVKYAFPMDELQPLSADGVNDFYGWSLSVVEALDTAIIMNLTNIVEFQLAHIATIDFTQPHVDGPVVDTFDTNIRIIGGLLSAYDLLHSGLFTNQYSKSNVAALLQQAVTLANKIAYVFNTPTGLAAANVNFATNQPSYSTITINGVTYDATDTAGGGTYILEWARLSDLTGNSTYRELTQRSENIMINPSPPPTFPGLVGTNFDPTTGKLLTFDGGWHAGVDSFLEYLIKTYQYEVTPNTTAYKNFWVTAVESTIEHIALKPYGFGNSDFVFISELNTNGSITYTEDDFTCFAGGNFLLGGVLLGSQQIIDLGLATTRGCIQTYDTTVTGLGPIEWAWFNSTDQQVDIQDDNDSIEHKFQAQKGYYIPTGAENWEFRPESIESTFYAHRITGDPYWADEQWNVFLAINNTAQNNIAFATVNNVAESFGGAMSDNMDSFFFAEVLKYLYLTFSDPTVVSLDQFVFNTECHPLLVQCGIGNIDDAPGTTGVGI